MGFWLVNVVEFTDFTGFGGVEAVKIADLDWICTSKHGNFTSMFSVLSWSKIVVGMFFFFFNIWRINTSGMNLVLTETDIFFSLKHIWIHGTRGIIPKWAELFRLGKYYNLPRWIQTLFSHLKLYLKWCLIQGMFTEEMWVNGQCHDRSGTWQAPQNHEPNLFTDCILNTV